MPRKTVAKSRCALCGAKEVSEPRGEEKYCRDCWDKKIAVEEIVAREFALKRYIRAHSAEKYLIYHSTLKRPCGQLIVVDDGYDLFLTMMLYPNFGWDEPAYHLEGDPEGRLFSELLVDVVAAEVIEPWGGGKWHMEIFRSVEPRARGLERGNVRRLLYNPPTSAFSWRIHMNRARLAFAATRCRFRDVCRRRDDGTGDAGSAHDSPCWRARSSRHPSAARRSSRYVKPVTKAQPGKNMVLTTIKVRNASLAPIARLQVTETWYDKGGTVVASSRSAINGLLQPQEIQTMTIETPYSPKMSSNNWNFTHANGTVKIAKVKIARCAEGRGSHHAAAGRRRSRKNGFRPGTSGLSVALARTC